MKNYKTDFPLLQKQNIVYLDNAATMQRPEAVLNAEWEFYEKYNANPIRGIYRLGVEATERYEQARKKVQHFLHAKSSKEIIFTRNTTESINLVAYSYGLHFLKPEDEIVVLITEHHSNILPWQMVSKQTGAKLIFLDCETDGSFSDEKIGQAITEHTKFAAIGHISNVTGRINPVEKLIAKVHANGGAVLVDVAQSAPHMPIDVQKMNADFLVFSGHKLMAPMGIGVLYGKEELLEKMPPFLTGGEMIDSVKKDSAVFAPLPQKFEAGTVNAAGAYALGAAIDYLLRIGWQQILERERALTAVAMNGMGKIPGVQILGSRNPEEHCSIISFTLDGVHPHDVASILDADHIAVRAGHHCAQPLLEHLGVGSCIRVSISFYNTREDIERLIGGLADIRRKMGYE